MDEKTGLNIDGVGNVIAPRGVKTGIIPREVYYEGYRD